VLHRGDEFSSGGKFLSNLKAGGADVSFSEYGIPVRCGGTTGQGQEEDE
jgi:hypothetical protein